MKTRHNIAAATAVAATLTITSGMLALGPASTAALAQTGGQMSAKRTIASWPATPRKVAGEMMQKYGAPREVTPTHLVWYNNGPWKKTIVYRQEVPHAFPMKHTDLLEQFVDYKVPTDKYDELAEYDGSVVAQRTMGELSARCDKEPMNFLALNLAHDVAKGTKTVEEARAFYAKTAMAFMKGQKDPYTQRLMFDGVKAGTKDADKPAPGAM